MRMHSLKTRLKQSTLMGIGLEIMRMFSLMIKMNGKILMGTELEITQMHFQMTKQKRLILMKMGLVTMLTLMMMEIHGLMKMKMTVELIQWINCPFLPI